MSLVQRVRRAKAGLGAAGAGIGLGVMAANSALAQQAPDAPPPPPAEGPTLKERAARVFNESDVTSTGWALPLYHIDTNTTVRAEVSYADFTPGLHVHHQFAEGEADAGFMNFSQNVFPLGDTLSFNSKGDLYSNGQQTGKQFGLRYSDKLELGPGSLEGTIFAGAAASSGAPSTGVTLNYRQAVGNWHLLAGGGAAWLGEKDGMALNAIGAAQRDFTYTTMPDGRLTMGIELKDQFGPQAQASAAAFAEYQTHLEKDGPAWLHHLSALFGVYGGTQSYGGKAGILYTPHTVGKKDFGVSFGPSVGWDSREGGPQVNLELRAGF